MRRNAELPEGVEIASASFVADSAKVDSSIKVRSLVVQAGAVIQDVRMEGIELWVGERAVLDGVNSPENGVLEVGAATKLRNVSLASPELSRGVHDVFVSIGERSEVERASLRGAVKIGNGCQVSGIWSSGVHGTESEFVTIADSEIGNDVTIRAGNFHLCKVGAGAALTGASVLRKDSVVGPGSRADYLTLSDGAVFHGTAGEHVDVYNHARVGNPETDERVFFEGGGAQVVGEHTTIGGGTRVHPHVRIGPHCKIGKNVTIGKLAYLHDYVVVEDGVTIGASAEIKAGNVISEDVPARATIEKPALKVPVDRPAFSVQADAESWKLQRLAEIAERSPGKRLDKRTLMKEHPQLVETATVSGLLKKAPPPTATELHEKARIFERHPKYNVYFVPEGWKGIQVIGRGSNDVLLFDVDKDVVDGLAASYPLRALPVLSEALTNADPYHAAAGRSFVHAILDLGKTDAHPGGERPLCVGWARVKPYVGHKSILVEELQTDLVALAFDPARELWSIGKEHSDYLHRLGVQPPMACIDGGRLGYGPSKIIPSIASDATHSVQQELKKAFLSLGRYTGKEEWVPSGWAYENALAMVGFYRCALPEGTWAHVIALGEPGEYGYRPPITDALLLHGVAAALIMDQSPSRYRPQVDVDEWVQVVFGTQHFDPVRVELTRAIAQRNRTLWDAERPDMDEGPEAVEAVRYHRFSHPAFQLMRKDAEAIIEKARVLIEWGLHTIRLFRETFSDLYESMLAGVFKLAREQELRDVWLLDYGTKYALAAYEGLEPPRSVYTDLPKRFQVAPVQKLPEYMDVSKYEEERGERLMLPRAKEMPKEPMGRRLLPNRD